MTSTTMALPTIKKRSTMMVKPKIKKEVNNDGDANNDDGVNNKK